MHIFIIMLQYFCMNNAGNDSSVLYENTILLDPVFLYAFKKINPIKIVLNSNKEIVIHSSPIITIPFSKIRSVKYGWLLRPVAKVILTDGTVYRIVWASEDLKSSFRYSPLETADIYNNIKRIIN